MLQNEQKRLASTDFQGKICMSTDVDVDEIGKNPWPIFYCALTVVQAIYSNFTKIKSLSNLYQLTNLLLETIKLLKRDLITLRYYL